MPASPDPFRFVSKASAPIQDLARRVWAITRPSAASIWIGRGWDTAASGSTEHHSGRALDIMVSAKVGRMPTMAEAAAGEQMVAWLIRHADQMHVRHVIWNRRIWKRRYRGTATAWSRLTGRSGVSDWHEDHIHVYLDDTAGSIPDAPLVPDGTIPARPIPTPPSPEEDDIMAMTEQQRNALVGEIAGAVWAAQFTEDGKRVSAGDRLARAATPVNPWAAQFGGPGARQTAGERLALAVTQPVLTARVAALEEMIRQIPGGEGVDLTAVERIADEAAERALAKLGEQLSA